MNVTMNYSVTFASEWHVGSGRGRPGDVDRLVKRRRRTQLPYLPAKTLTGVWRWEAENVAEAFAAKPAGDALADLVRVLFGDTPAEDGAARRNSRPTRGRASRGRPRPAAVSVRSADFAPDVVGALDANDLQPHVAMVVSQTAIEESGVAMSKTLRRTEVVRRGAELHGRVDLNLSVISDSERARALALLVVSAERLRRIGGKRNRGMGRFALRFEIPDFIRAQINPANDVLVWALTELTTVTDLRIALPDPVPTPVRESDGEIELLELVISAIDPLVIEDVVVGNVTRTLDCIPGARLLPIVAGALRRVGIDPDPMIDAGTLQIRNALPDVGGSRGLPVPLSFYETRREFRSMGTSYAPLGAGGAGVVNLLAGDVVPVRPDIAMFQQVRSGWIADDRSSSVPTYRAALPTRVETMNTIDDSRGRTHSDVGGLYSYETLDDGEVFRSVIIATSSVATALRSIFGGDGQTDRVGTSKKDDFGRVHISLGSVVSSAGPLTSETVEAFTLWCVSPLLVLTGDGTPITSLGGVADILGDLLGAAVSVDRDEVGDRCWSRPFRSETWKARWGLPNPSLVGISAGSVAAFRCVSPVSTAALQRLELVGLGLRRAAGFGEIRISHRAVDEPRLGRSVATPEAVSTRRAGSELAESVFAESILVAEWRSRVQRAAAIAKLDELLGHSAASITASRLGGFRDAVSQMSGPQDPVWLPKGLREQAADPLTLGAAFATLPARLLGERGLLPPVPDLSHALWREAVVTIVDAAIRNAIRGGTVRRDESEGDDHA